MSSRGRPPGPRIRTVKPERYQDERFAGVCRDARHLYDGLTIRADDEGRGSANPALIRANVFPYDHDVDALVIEAWLEQLAEAGLVELYEADGRAYFHVTSWADDQRIDRATPSRVPPPPSSSSDIPREESREVASAQEDSASSQAGPDRDRDQNGPAAARARPAHASAVEKLLAPVAKRCRTAMPPPEQLDELLAEHVDVDAVAAAREVVQWSKRQDLRNLLGALRTTLAGAGPAGSPASTAEPCPNGTTDAAAVAAWNEALPTLRERVSEQVFAIHFERLHPHRVDGDGTLVLAVDETELGAIKDKRLDNVVAAVIDGPCRFVTCTGGHA